MARRTRQQREGAASKTAVLSYTNRFGDTYSLHEGRTRTGKARYFAAKTLREGALSAMPEGFEFCESINGVVSVRRIDLSAANVPEADVALARAEMARYVHLQGYRIEVIKGEIVVFEPMGGTPPDWATEVARRFFMRPKRFPGRGWQPEAPSSIRPGDEIRPVARAQGLQRPPDDVPRRWRVVVAACVGFTSRAAQTIPWLRGYRRVLRAIVNVADS